MELFVSDCPRAEQPQCVSRSKLNLRRRNCPHKNNPPTEATIASETACCQFMLATYPQKRFAQPIFAVTHFGGARLLTSRLLLQSGIRRAEAGLRLRGDEAATAAPARGRPLHRSGKLRHHPIFGVELSAHAFTLRPCPFHSASRTASATPNAPSATTFIIRAISTGSKPRAANLSAPLAQRFCNGRNATLFFPSSRPGCVTNHPPVTTTC